MGAIALKAAVERYLSPSTIYLFHSLVNNYGSYLYSIQRAKIKPEEVQEVYMGNVLQANEGQAPATQVVIKGG